VNDSPLYEEGTEVVSLL